MWSFLKFLLFKSISYFSTELMKFQGDSRDIMKLEVVPSIGHFSSTCLDEKLKTFRSILDW